MDLLRLDNARHIGFAADQVDLVAPDERLEVVTAVLVAAQLDHVAHPDLGRLERLAIPRLGAGMLVGMVVALRVVAWPDRAHDAPQRLGVLLNHDHGAVIHFERLDDDVIPQAAYGFVRCNMGKRGPGELGGAPTGGRNTFGGPSHLGRPCMRRIALSHREYAQWTAQTLENW